MIRDTSKRDADGLHIAILGSGSAAFAAALHAANAGARISLIEHGTVGGTCVNIGCVPSKILIRAAHVAHLQAQHPFSGISRQRPIVDRGALVAQQQARVDELRQAKYANLLETNSNITLIRGHAHFKDGNTLAVTGSEGNEKIVHADRILIATGRRP